MKKNLNKLRVITDFLENSAETYPEKTALVFEDRTFTYKDLQKKAGIVSGFLTPKTRPDDVIALLLPNSPEFVVYYFGVLGAGATALVLPANISDENLTFQVKKTAPRYIVSLKKYADKLERTGVLKKMKFIDAKKELLATKSVKRKISGDFVSTIIFTSGSTSEPKGAKLTHNNVVNATKNIIEFLKFRSDDTDINISQLSHSFGLGHMHCVFAVSGTMVLFRDTINLKRILKSIKTYGGTTFGAVPAILRLLVENFPEEFAECGAGLRFIQTNTSSLDKNFIKKILNLLPKTDFCYYYGLTEASRASFINFSENRGKLESVGRPSPNVEIKIVENGKTLPPGKIGEIAIKGGMVIQKYWKNPKASKRIMDGWFMTNDCGYLDKAGFLYFKGRKDDMLNIGGEKVMPEEIENVIKKIPGVTDAAVIGVSNRLLGEAPKAFVAARGSFDEKIVIRECRKHLESFKVPQSVEIIEKIPRTPNGKLQRGRLK